MLGSRLALRLLMSDFAVTLLLLNYILIGRKCELLGNAKRVYLVSWATHIIWLLNLSLICFLEQSEHLCFTAVERRCFEVLVLLDFLSFRRFLCSYAFLATLSGLLGQGIPLRYVFGRSFLYSLICSLDFVLRFFSKLQLLDAINLLLTR